MSYVLANNRVSFTFDDDATTGLKLTSFKRLDLGAHVWTNAQNKLWIARCWDTTTAPTLTTADFTPTLATIGAIAVVSDATGKSLTVTWTAVPIGTDALTVTLKFRLENGEDRLRVTVESVAWVGTPTKQALHAFCPLPLAVDPFHSGTDWSCMQSTTGIKIGNPILNHRFSNGVSGFPNTAYGTASNSCEGWYPSTFWQDPWWGYYETTDREGWMVFAEDLTLAPAKVRFESDATRMVFEWFEEQEDSVLVANNSRALGSDYTLVLRPLRTTTDEGWWDVSDFYRERLEAEAPPWLPARFEERVELSDHERSPFPFVGIQMLGSAQNAEVARLPALLASLRSGTGIASTVPIVGNVESPPHLMERVGEAAVTNLRAMVRTLYDAGSTYLTFWKAGVPFPTSYDIAIWHQTLGDSLEKRWWTANDGQGALRMQRKGYIQGGGADRLAESVDGTFERHRTYTISNWNAGTRTLTVGGGNPSTDFTGYAVGGLRAVIVPASGSAVLAEALIQSLGATTIVITAASATFKDSLGNTVTPTGADTVVLLSELDGWIDFCDHAMVNSAAWMQRIKANWAEGIVDSYRGCGQYLDLGPEPHLGSVGTRGTPCHRDHTGWSKEDVGTVRHPFGGGSWHGEARRELISELRDAGRARQEALGRDPFFMMSSEFSDGVSRDLVAYSWTGLGAGYFFRNTNTFDPTIHQHYAIPSEAVVHAGRGRKRGGNNEEFSTADGAPAAITWIETNVGVGQAAILRKYHAYRMAEWVYGMTMPVLQFFSNDAVGNLVTTFADLWDDTIYVAGGGSVPNEVKEIRDLYGMMVLAETRTFRKWFRRKKLGPPLKILSGTSLTTGLAQTAIWAPIYGTYDIVSPRASHPRVASSVWPSPDDGSLLVAMMNWTDTAGTLKAELDLQAHGIPKNTTVRIRKIDHRGRTLEAQYAPNSTIITLQTDVPKYTVQAFVIDRIFAKSGPIPSVLGARAASSSFATGVDIPGVVARSIGPLAGPATLVKVGHSTRSTSDPVAAPGQVENEHDCRAFVLDYTERERIGDIVQEGDRKVVILGATLAAGIVPEPNDLVRVEGEEYRIADGGVIRDPAAATYECRARR